MGTYLSTPVLDKHTEKGSDLTTDKNIPVRWAVVDMQGWRKSMEDAHVARTDVALPSWYAKNKGDGGGEGDNTVASHAKVFAVFDGHGGAEVARYCQIHLVPTLISQSHWTAADSSNSTHDNEGGEDTVVDEEISMSVCIGRALIDSFHKLDTCIDDPNSRNEIDSWRSERPTPYISSNDDTNTDGAAAGNIAGNTDSVGETNENNGGLTAETNLDESDIQERRHTVMDPSEIAESAKIGHLIDAGDDSPDDSSDEDNKEDTGVVGGGEEEKKGGEVDETTTAENKKPRVEKHTVESTDNLGSILDNDEDDEDEEVFEDSLSEPIPEDDCELENKAVEGVVDDDSDDDDEKEEHSNANETDDGEVEEEITTAAASDEGEGGEEEKSSGTMVMSANDAVSLFQKLLNMNGSNEDENDDDKDDEDEVEWQSTVNGDNNGEGENDAGEEQEEEEVVIPTREQLLNPPTGVVAPSASIPTRIQNGRKICNLPDHAVHAGCTSVVAVIVGKTLVVANAGDSRAVICRAGGLTEPLSFDHKPLQNREMNRITNSGGFVNQFGRVNGNLNLSRSIGDLKYKQVPGIPPSEQMITAEPDILR